MPCSAAVSSVARSIWCASNRSWGNRWRCQPTASAPANRVSAIASNTQWVSRNAPAGGTRCMQPPGRPACGSVDVTVVDLQRMPFATFKTHVKILFGAFETHAGFRIQGAAPQHLILVG